jgi:hypothetical protein
LPSRWSHIEHRAPSRSATFSSSSAMSGQTANSLPVVYGAGAGTCTKCVLKGKTPRPLQNAATASCWKARNHIPPTIEAAGTRRWSCRRGNYGELPKPQREGRSPLILRHQMSPSRRRSEAVQYNSSNLRHAKLLWQILPQE